MFDDLEQKKVNTPEKEENKKEPLSPPGVDKNQIKPRKKPVNADDMFSGVSDLTPPLPEKGSGIPMPIKKEKKPSGNILKTIFFIILLMLVVAISAIIAGKIFGVFDVSNISFKFKKTEETKVINNKEEKQTTDNPVVNPDPVNLTNDKPEKEEPAKEINLDTDGDGMTDEDEKLIGTDINNPDTDGDRLSDTDEFLKYKTDPLKADTDADGLSDYEEIITYKTDPKNPDTDGDTYLDGKEVEGGYNPNGEGKLE